MNTLILAFLLATAPPAYDPALNAAVFDRAWSLVDGHYWDRDRRGAEWEAARARFRPRAISAADGRALYAVLREMLATLGDSHVFADDPASVRFDALREGGTHGGFGFATAEADGGWQVFAIQPDSPAAASGVQIGWRLVSVNGRPPQTDYHPAPGEVANLVFADETGRTHPLRLTGALLPPVPDRRATLLPGNVLLIGLDWFDGRPDRWIADEIAVADPAAVILDLRENYGGEAVSVARVAGGFFSRKQTLLRRIGRKGPLDVPTLGAGRRAFAGPLAVLVGPRTASGAEAIAAAVEESGRGITIGQRTAGALTGAARFSLPDGGELSVAEFDIRTSADRRLEGVGFTPRHVVDPGFAALRAGRDPAVERALALLARQD
ncbi:MAG: C-terminal processing protease CtpA/Prc, contains a domain [Sphingomonas bacterium]|nr:S41 family peptidase [Sphingomonas bacterium]MDB5690138.1 C-terminal processing protease CtpA/Prc, contains a domain [Sphingomonas bacterium]